MDISRGGDDRNPPLRSPSVSYIMTKPNSDNLNVADPETLAALQHSDEKARFYETEMGYSIRIISGSANKSLADKIAAELGVKPEPVEITTFPDGEIDIHVLNNVRGSDMFVVQPTCPPKVNDHLMELLLLIHTLRLASVKRLTVVIPYFGYARQDRKVKPRVPISASAVAQLLESVQPSRIVTCDLHSGQIQGFFHHTPVDNLYAEWEMVRYIKSKVEDVSSVTVVSPDAGGVNRAGRIADILDARDVVTCIKRRSIQDRSITMQIVGDVAGAVCFIVDDMIDTAGTLTKAANLLAENGASAVYAFATHGLFSGPAIERINKSVLVSVCVTDSIPQDKNLEICPKLQVVSLVPLLAKTIKRLHDEKSLAALFKEDYLQST